jgi:hypothetical protein
MNRDRRSEGDAAIGAEGWQCDHHAAILFEAEMDEVRRMTKSP